MAYNILAGVPAVILATKTVSFQAAGLNALNTEVVYKIGAVSVSWVPDSPINPLTGFEYNQGYLIVPRQNIDLTGVVQTQIAEEENKGGTGSGGGGCCAMGVPFPVDIRTTGVDDPEDGGSTFLSIPELFGVQQLLSFSRDGITQMVIYTGTPDEKQVLYNADTYELIPPASNPFGQEDLHIEAIRVPVQWGKIDFRTTGSDDPTNGGKTFVYFPELVGIPKLARMSRDGITQTVIYSGTPEGSLQVRFDSVSGRIYPPADNPFGAEDLFIKYQKPYV